MGFIKDTVQILKNTSWPSKKQGWTDFVSVLQYTTFFVVLIYLFDIALGGALSQLLNLF